MIRRPPESPGAILFLAAFLLFFLMMAGCTEEQTRQVEPAPEAQPADAPNALASGRASYEAYCMSCHGADGTGTGELVGDLNVLPADLTQLSSNNGGTFPLEKVIATVDGREQVKGHGTREMPVWGNIWSEEDGTPLPEEVAQERINELVEYLRSIQAQE